MVLERILNIEKAENNALKTLLIGFSYGTIALFLSLWIFQEQASMVMVFLVTLATAPLMYSLLNKEEERDKETQKPKIKQHKKAIRFYLTLFIGISLAFTIWYLVLPKETTSNVFKVQSQTISNLNQQVTGKIAHTTLLSKIFLNNIKVLIFCLLFSFIYGAGAMFILSWNASVIGAAAGNFIRTHATSLADTTGLHLIGGYFYVGGLSILRYAIHGIPEILAYIIAGIAGGILSIAIIKKKLESKELEKVLLDVSDLVLLSVFILFIAAIIEVFVTPVLF
ncbi:hypothetical protein DRJ22_00670 [Candidatus Woesearchaeota archaeon]|nr:MAG: hypothetical protein DRJ22_00670 [Candidatus Woesearchaeota archaeon]